MHVSSKPIIFTGYFKLSKIHYCYSWLSENIYLYSWGSCCTQGLITVVGSRTDVNVDALVPWPRGTRHGHIVWQLALLQFMCSSQDKCRKLSTRSISLLLSASETALRKDATTGVCCFFILESNERAGTRKIKQAFTATPGLRVGAYSGGLGTQF